LLPTKHAKRLVKPS